MRALAPFAVALALAAPAHAEETALDAGQLRALGAQVANVYGMDASEADFIEIEGSPSNGARQGHAVFARTGFVLDYTSPAGRRVVGDFTRVRVLEAGRPARVQRAASSPYAPVLLLSGTRAPAFTRGTQRDLLYDVVEAQNPGTTFEVEMTSSRVVLIKHGAHPDLHFRNIQSMPALRANALVNATLASAP